MVSSDRDLTRKDTPLEKQRIGMKFFYLNLDALAEKYPDMAVAILGQSVVGSDTDQLRLYESLKIMGIDSRYVFVDSTSKKNYHISLSD